MMKGGKEWISWPSCDPGAQVAQPKHHSAGQRTVQGQSRAEQSRAEQSRAEQSRAEQRAFLA
jgi:hypothetical protein